MPLPRSAVRYASLIQVMCQGTGHRPGQEGTRRYRRVEVGGREYNMVYTVMRACTVRACTVRAYTVRACMSGVESGRERARGAGATVMYLHVPSCIFDLHITDAE